ncbi:uncharacterized protein LOC130443709 [Diorhabda sublineata]|uniref:uncharacterized protein LOC130443709 n=1 Tax=Diorhabda sublineata TaxID=1163346 RepID=UPI0024E06880|nr:uncharacterized protein LOC130443709 [Diorhabda sublineata]
MKLFAILLIFSFHCLFMEGDARGLDSVKNLDSSSIEVEEDEKLILGEKVRQQSTSYNQKSINKDEDNNNMRHIIYVPTKCPQGQEKDPNGQCRDISN